MLTIRGADQACTSLRAARKSLGESRVSPVPQIKDLDLIIGELAVGAPTYVGNAEKSKQEIELLIAALSQPAAAGTLESTPAVALSDGAAQPRSRGVEEAMPHFRRAVSALQRFINIDENVLP